MSDPSDQLVSTDWHNRGFDHDAATRWARIGADPAAAGRFRDAGFDPDTAAPWFAPRDDAQVRWSAETARQWSDAPVGPGGIGPSEADEWYRIKHSPRSAVDAITAAHELGYHTTGDWVPDPNGPSPRVQAGDWAYSGISPTAATQWTKAGFAFNDGQGPRAAQAWSTAGFSPGDAADWRKCGVTPENASRLRQVGATPATYTAGDETFLDPKVPMQVYLDRDHWRHAGITDGVVARNWHFNGFTAAEAADWNSFGAQPQFAGVWKRLGYGAAQAGEWLSVLPDLVPANAERIQAAGWTPASAKAHIAQMTESQAYRWVGNMPAAPSSQR